MSNSISVDSVDSMESIESVAQKILASNPIAKHQPWRMVNGPPICVPRPPPGWAENPQEGRYTLAGGTVSGGDATIWCADKRSHDNGDGFRGEYTTHEIIAGNCLREKDAAFIVLVCNSAEELSRTLLDQAKEIRANKIKIKELEDELRFTIEESNYRY